MKNFRLKFFPISKVHLMILILFVAAFCTGSLLGKTTGQLLPDYGSVSASSENTSWGLSFQEKGKRPIGNASIEELKKYNAYYYFFSNSLFDKTFYHMYFLSYLRFSFFRCLVKNKYIAK